MLRTLLGEVKQLLKLPLPQWLPDHPTAEDMAVFKKEALGQSQFDPLKLRENLWRQLEQHEAQIVCRSSTNVKVLFIQPKRSRVEPPWDLWARIFQWLGPSKSGTPWRVFWFPATTKRILPIKGEPVTSQHVNGGYSYPCRSDTIVVYRLEEATRVLVHEILHAACLDPPTNVLEYREANVETWAELFLVALCSGGDYKRALELWKIQSQWIADQNYILRNRFNVNEPKDFAWRYTVGREYILRTLKIDLPEGKLTGSRSSRLTSPYICP